MTPMNTDARQTAGVIRTTIAFFAFSSVLIGVHRPLTSFAAEPATSQRASSSPQVAALVAEFGPRLLKSRYMEQGVAMDVTIAGWEGFPTKRYTYAVTDKDNRKKLADVVLLDPTAEQVATWIVSAIREVTGGDDDALAKKAFANVIGQSGGQFPVAGVVYEDILPADGVNEAYAFRDGVTVAVDGMKHRETDRLSPAMIEASITGQVNRVFRYARIQSTTPEQYIAIGGDAGVLGADGKPTKAWPSTIRREYQAAWRSERNALIVAWVKAQVASSTTTSAPATRPAS